MSYLRGDTYIWSSGDRTHFWIADGDDHWRESGWIEGRGESATGVAILQDTVDEFVMMRVAEMIDAELVGAAIDRALENGSGNGGCLSLANQKDELRSMLARIPKLKSPDVHEE